MSAIDSHGMLLGAPAPPHESRIIGSIRWLAARGGATRSITGPPRDLVPRNIAEIDSKKRQVV